MSDHQEPSREWHQTPPQVPRPDPVSRGYDNPSTITSDDAQRSMGVDLRDHFEMRITSVDEKNVMRVEALAKELAVAMRANAIAIDKAEASVNQRLLSMNEFREQLNSQAATFATQENMHHLEKGILEKIDALEVAAGAERKAIRDGLEAKIDALNAAGIARAEAARSTRDAEIAALWKFIYGLATAIAVIQTILQFKPIG